MSAEMGIVEISNSLAFPREHLNIIGCVINEEDGQAQIYLNNPPVNALSIKLIENMHSILIKMSKNKNVKLVQIRSSLKNHFSAGADLKERALMSDKDALLFLDKLNDCFDMIENLKVPTICLLEGGAVLGGGAELALCCDIIAAIDSNYDYKIGFPETSIGIIPGAGGTYRINKKMNLGIAKHWILSGRQFNIDEACNNGFVDFHASDDEDYIKFIDSILKNSRTSLIAAKKSMNMCYMETDRKKQRLIELEEYKNTLSSTERKEALKKYKKK